MKKWILVLLSGFLLIGASYAQVEEEIEDDSDFWDRVYIGGNLGLQFGSITSVEVSPLAGYRFSNTFSAGFGVTYQYFKADYVNGFGQKIDYETNIYGGRLFARKNVTQQIFAHAEYESLNLEFYNPLADQKLRQWVPALFIGGGLFQPVGSRAGFNVMVLYNVMHDDLKSPYNSPLVVRAGITAGF